MGYKPVNKYLPPRPRRDAATTPASHSTSTTVPLKTDGSATEKLFAWADKLLSR